MIPVVFIHHARQFDWIDCVLAKARDYNPEVYLIGDQEQRTHNIADYSVDYQRFEKAFENYSTNPRYFEMTAFSRWIILNEYCQKHNIDVVFHLDSDTMLYADATAEYERIWHQYPMSMVLGECGATCYFTQEHLAGLSELILRTYIDKNDDFKWLKDMYARMQAQGLDGGANDMVLVKLYRTRNNLPYGEMTDVRDGAAYDHILRAADPGGYRMTHGIKDIEFKEGIPYATVEATGEQVRMRNLHFQGRTDELIPLYRSMRDGRPVVEGNY